VARLCGSSTGPGDGNEGGAEHRWPAAGGGPSRLPSLPISGILIVVHPFTCPRCRRTSRSPQDALQGYCGHCHAWTGPPSEMQGQHPQGVIYDELQALAGPPPRRRRRLPREDRPSWPPEDIRETAPCRAPRYQPAECELTPHVLLDGPPWHYEGTEDDGRTAVYRFSPLDSPWVSSWRPDASLGACTVDWSRGPGELRLKLSAEVMARAVMDELHYLAGDIGQSWSWEELRQLYYQRRLMVNPHWMEYASQASPGTYRCGQCGTEFAVPEGHTGPVLCGHHSPPEFMRPVLSRPALDQGSAQAVPDTMAGWQELPCPVSAEGLFARLTGREMSVEFQLDESAALQVYREMLGAGGCTADEAREYLGRYSRSVLDGSGYTCGGLGPSAGTDGHGNSFPDGLGRGEVLPQMSHIPDHCPPPRALPGTMAPDERHADGDTAAHTMASDYDDPERVFL
jgi:hypothetical protein